MKPGRDGIEIVKGWYRDVKILIASTTALQCIDMKSSIYTVVVQ